MKFDTYMNLNDYLDSIGNVAGKNGLRFSPLVDEKTPSFSVYGDKKTLWKCYASDKKGVGIVSLLEAMHNLKDIPNGTKTGKTKTVFMQVQDIINGSYTPPTHAKVREKEMIEKPKNVLTVQGYEPVKSPSLVNYLLKRGIPIWLHPRISEIKYWNSKANMMFYSIALKNDSNGYPHRNPRFKGNIGQADVTTINKGKNKYKIFEGMLDFFSYVVINKNSKRPVNLKDYTIAVLNSTTHINKFVIPPRATIDLYLDNGRSGDIATLTFMEKYKHCIDKRRGYENFDDLNDLLMQKPKTKIEFRIKKEDDSYNIYNGLDWVGVELELKKAIKFIEDRRKKPKK